MSTQTPLERKVAGLLAQSERAQQMADEAKHDGNENDRMHFQHEADTFRQAAMEKMAKYGLDEASLRASKRDMGRIVQRRQPITGKYKTSQVKLWHALCRALHCQSTHKTSYKSVTLYGMEGHAQRVVILFTLLLPQMLRDIDKADYPFEPDELCYMPGAERAGLTRSYRTSFGAGWTHAIEDLLSVEEQKVATSDEAKATGADLVLLSDAEKARKELERIHPKLKAAKFTRPSAGYHNGRAAGQRADLATNRLQTKKGITA